MEVEKKRSTNVQQQRQPGDSLHGEDEEGDHGQASTLTAAFDVLQGLFEGSVAAPERRTGSLHPLVFNQSQRFLARILGYSQQPLQRPLLERLIGAIDDVGLKMTGSVVLNNVANVLYDWILIVTPFQVLKKP